MGIVQSPQEEIGNPPVVLVRGTGEHILRRDVISRVDAVCASPDNDLVPELEVKPSEVRIDISFAEIQFGYLIIEFITIPVPDLCERAAEILLVRFELERELAVAAFQVALVFLRNFA